jgi:hypothetical protein
MGQSGKTVERAGRLEIDRFDGFWASQAKQSMQLLAAKIAAAVEKKRMFFGRSVRHDFTVSG